MSRLPWLPLLAFVATGTNHLVTICLFSTTALASASSFAQTAGGSSVDEVGVPSARTPSQAWGSDRPGVKGPVLPLADQLRQNDQFGLLLDTFHDRRNGFQFYTNPLGARADGTISDEANPSSDWNAVWEVRTGRFDGGWTVGMAIPFRTLRYRDNAAPVWGIQFQASSSAGRSAGKTNRFICIAAIGRTKDPGPRTDRERKPKDQGHIATRSRS